LFIYSNPDVSFYIIPININKYKLGILTLLNMKRIKYPMSTMCDIGSCVIIIVHINPCHKYVTSLKKQEEMEKRIFKVKTIKV
jgi:hypothetical protein